MCLEEMMRLDEERWSYKRNSREKQLMAIRAMTAEMKARVRVGNLGHKRVPWVKWLPGQVC